MEKGRTGGEGRGGEGRGRGGEGRGCAEINIVIAVFR